MKKKGRNFVKKKERKWIKKIIIKRQKGRKFVKKINKKLKKSIFLKIKKFERKYFYKKARKFIKRKKIY